MAIQTGGKGIAFDPRNDSRFLAVYNAQNIQEDIAGQASVITNLISSPVLDLIQTSVDSQPLVISNGLNGRQTLRFDGVVDSMLQTASNNSFDDSFSFIIAFKQISYIADNNIYGHIALFALKQGAVEGRIVLTRDANTGDEVNAIDLPLDQWGVVIATYTRDVFCRLMFNLNAPITTTINIPDTPVPNFRLGGKVAGPPAINQSNIEVADLWIYNGDIITDGLHFDAAAYLMDKNKI